MIKLIQGFCSFSKGLGRRIPRVKPKVPFSYFKVVPEKRFFSDSKKIVWMTKEEAADLGHKNLEKSLQEIVSKPK